MRQHTEQTSVDADSASKYFEDWHYDSWLADALQGFVTNQTSGLLGALGNFLLTLWCFAQFRTSFLLHHWTSFFHVFHNKQTAYINFVQLHADIFCQMLSFSFTCQGFPFVYLIHYAVLLSIFHIPLHCCLFQEGQLPKEFDSLGCQ